MNQIGVLYIFYIIKQNFQFLSLILIFYVDKGAMLSNSSTTKTSKTPVAPPTSSAAPSKTPAAPSTSSAAPSKTPAAPPTSPSRKRKCDVQLSNGEHQHQPFRPRFRHPKIRNTMFNKVIKYYHDEICCKNLY